MKMQNLKIGQRLGLGFGAVLILLAAVVLLGLHNLSAMNDRLVNIVEKTNARRDAATDMRDAQRQTVIDLRDLVLVTDEAQMAELSKWIETNVGKYDEAAGRLDKLAQQEDTRALLARIASARAVTTPLIAKIEALGRQNQNEQATVLLRKELVPATNVWLQALNDMIDLQTRRNREDQQLAMQEYASARLLLVVIGLGAAGLALVVGWLITRSVTRPIGEAVRVAQTVAAGDLTSRIEVSSTDETGQLLLALKEMNASLQNIVGRVRGGTDAIATASAQIASGNLDLSSRTEQQASSLEETASSMEELTSTVKQNAENARQANQLALSASTVATRGGTVVDSVVQTMGAIDGSARKIVDIISVIDGIAFQTNILALNAAVEAARAGEQGRGFAVVASEVRNLAQRSASAAKEIKQLINDSVDKVGEGSRLVGEAGATMQEILTSVQRVTDIMAEITMASREQESGIEQINAAVNEMDVVTQQNAALVEEAAAAAKSLQDQSGGLADVVSMFKLPVDPQAQRTLSPAAPARATPPAASQRRLPVRAGGRAAADAEWETF